MVKPLGDVAIARQVFRQEVYAACHDNTLSDADFCEAVAAARNRMEDAIRAHIHDFDDMFR